MKKSRNKENRIFLVCLGVIVIMCGCTTSKSNSEIGYTVNTSTETKRDVINKEQVYTLKTEDEAKAKIILDEGDKTFSFCYDPLSSYISYGEYSEGEYTDKIYMRTNDGKYEYVFDKEDNGKVLKFDKEHSSNLSIIDENITPDIVDGTEFISE